MGNGALNSPRGNNQFSRKDFENLEKMCRNSHFRDHFDDYKVTFHKAIDNDAIDMIELLIPAGNSKRLQPLHIACRLAKLESAELLISAGFSCVLLDEKGRTPLHLCCTSRSLDAGLCATLLVLASKKALAMRDSEGLTPLHLAAAQNNLHVIQALMNNGADVTITTAAGHSPYQVAMDNRNYEALNLLKEMVSNKSKSKKLTKKTNNTQQYLASGAAAQQPQQTQADMDRIMQVWEKFFENAFKRMGIDPDDLEDEPAAPPRSSSTAKSKSRNTVSYLSYDDSPTSNSNALHSTPQYDNWTSEDYYGDLNHYAEPASAKKSSKGGKSKAARQESKAWGDGFHPEQSSKSLAASTKSAYLTSYDSSYDAAYDYNYTNSYSYVYPPEAPYAAAENGAFEGSLDPFHDAQRVVDWFEWTVFYEDGLDPEADEGVYYVLNKSTGEMLWLEDHLEAFQRGTLLPCADWHDYELHMSYPLPTTLLETIARGWLTYYEAAESTCKWINLPTKSIEALLPVGIGEHAQVLYDLGLAVCDSDSRYYSADQTCARAWVLVIGVSDTEGEHWDAKADSEEGALETVYYYRNRLTGETSWQPPGNWHELVAGWENWTLCCNEDSPGDLYW